MSLRVLLVTSWETNCGIAAHSSLLKSSVEGVGLGIEVIPSSEALDPTHDSIRSLYHDMAVSGIDVLHLNHHDALHSRWTPLLVDGFVQAGLPVLVTYHDTRSGAPGAENSEKLKAFCQVASSVVVHEPVEDVKAIYWRQGVPAPATHQAHYTTSYSLYGWRDGTGYLYVKSWKAFPQQPVLGTVGFNFPWKNYDRLCQLTAEEGWALVLLSNDATLDDEVRWRSINSSILVVRNFLPGDQVINYLAGCDATAFLYECSNTGTSGAIRQGIAARKPVIAFGHCRQFRDLKLDPLGNCAIHWPYTWEEARSVLHGIWRSDFLPSMSQLAERDSWTKLGTQYAALYHLLVGR